MPRECIEWTSCAPLRHTMRLALKSSASAAKMVPLSSREALVTSSLCSLKLWRPNPENASEDSGTE